MSKKKYFNTKLVGYMRGGNLAKLPTLLLNLKVIDAAQFEHFLETGNLIWMASSMRESARESQLRARSYSKRPPSIIKPRGTVR